MSSSSLLPNGPAVRPNENLCASDLRAPERAGSCLKDALAAQVFPQEGLGALAGQGVNPAQDGSPEPVAAAVEPAVQGGSAGAAAAAEVEPGDPDDSFAAAQSAAVQSPDGLRSVALVGEARASFEPHAHLDCPERPAVEPAAPDGLAAAEHRVSRTVPTAAADAASWCAAC